MACLGPGAGGAFLTADDQTGGLATLLAGAVVPAARGLLGAVIKAHGVRVRLTEVEAYAGVGADEASHAHRGLTTRNRVMFGPPGRLYVYRAYGVHWCLNITCGPDGEAAAVLLRAGEVIEGVALARARRPAARADRELARGPARLAAALGIDGAANDVDVLDPSSPVTVSAPRQQPDAALVGAGPRVGVAGAHQRPWRFWLDGEPTVSRYRPHHQAQR